MQVSTNSNLVIESITLLNKLGYNNNVCVSWTKGHANSLGNLIADELARKGALKPFTGPEPCLPILDCTWKQSIKARCAK